MARPPRLKADFGGDECHVTSEEEGATVKAKAEQGAVAARMPHSVMLEPGQYAAMMMASDKDLEGEDMLH